MTMHMFDTDHARAYGVNIRNRANGENFRKGRTWTYNSVKALADLFPYLTIKQVRGALARLVECGVLLTGNYNVTSRDRTLWYAFNNEECFLDGSHCHLPHKANADDGEGNSQLPAGANGSARKGKSLIRADGKPDGNTDSGRASRLPKDWQLTPEALNRTLEVTATYAENLTEWAGGEWDAGHTEFEAEKFRDYWCGKSGKDATKTDWPATWRNWVRNAGPMRGPGKKGGGAWWLSPESRKAKAHEVGVGDPIPGESDASYQARIQAAIDNGGKPPAPRAHVAPMQATQSSDAIEQRSTPPEGALQSLLAVAKRCSVPKHLTGEVR